MWNYCGIDKENKQIEIKVSCSKGTYIRSLCEDIAKKLETVGYMCELKRIQVGDFNIKDSIEVENLNEETINQKIISLEKIFEKNSKIKLNEKKLQLFLNGVKLSTTEKDGIYKIYVEQNFIGTGVVEKNKLKRDIIL